MRTLLQSSQIQFPDMTKATVKVLAVGCVNLFLLLNSPAMATSIVIQVDRDRILIAADTRGGKLNPSSKLFEEAECKIIPLGNAAFTVTGNVDYTQNQPNDSISSWDARTDAREAYAEQHGDLLATADNWAIRAKRHFLSFYLANPGRVKQLAQANDQNILLAGFFLGFQDGKAVLLARLIYLDEHTSSCILDKQVAYPARDAPYSSHGITQELIDGHSERAHAANADWQKKLPSIPADSQAFRRMEFLIQVTSTLDDTVGMRVNILEIFPTEKARWLQNLTCK